MSLLLALAAAALPTPQECTAVVSDPEAALAQSTGLQGFIYGYPIVDLLTQQFNETHRVDPNQVVIAPVNTIFVHPGLVTPATQGQLRAPNSDTLYLNAWIDLSRGPVLLDVPAMDKRYYTLAFMDLYAKPYHLGTRTNGGRAMRYALVGPSGGDVPAGYEKFELPTDTVWMLGRVMAADHADLVEAKRLSHAIVMTGPAGEPVSEAEPLKPTASLRFFDVLNKALKSLRPVPGEAGLMATFDAGGFGPTAIFDADKLSASKRLGLGCAVRIGPQVLATQGLRAPRIANGWISSSAMADPGTNYLLRAEVARGGYVNAPEESIYPAAIADSTGAPLTGAHRYRIRFAKGALPPVDAFWSISVYDRNTMHFVENAIHRYTFGDRTRGARIAKDGSLEIILSAERPREGTSNWLPIPPGPTMLVTRMYLPRPEALDGRYKLPPVERIDP